MSFGSLLYALPILIAQWVGILGLGRTARSPAWWCMFTGICFTTLGSLVSLLFMGLALTNRSLLESPGRYMGIFIAINWLTALGSLLFAIGFAIHGQQASRIQQRVTELEAIAAAQSEELDRARFRI